MPRHEKCLAMKNAQILEKIAQFSDFEAEYYLSLWLKNNTTQSGNQEKPRIAPNQLFNPANSGDMTRLALMTIVMDATEGEVWFEKTTNDNPYQGEGKNFSQDNNRSHYDVMTVLATAMGILSTKINFSVNGGKIDFSLSFSAMNNPLIGGLYQKVVSATPWFNAKAAEVKVALLTPIEVERKAILAQLGAWEHLTSKKTNTLFSVGSFRGLHHNFKIYNQLTGSGLNENAIAIENIMQELEPDLILMVGVAGGLKDVKKGDLVIGERAYGYEKGKLTEEGFLSRPQSYSYSHRLIQQSRKVLDLNTWSARIIEAEDWPKTDPSRIFFGPIVSGNKVLADSRAELAQFIKKQFNDSLAIEMEAISFQALLRYEGIWSLNIRGISDLLDDKAQADRQNYQPLAAARAAAFTFELLHQLDLKP
jgi:nucleoside phosphorylase